MGRRSFRMCSTYCGLPLRISPDVSSSESLRRTVRTEQRARVAIHSWDGYAALPSSLARSASAYSTRSDTGSVVGASSITHTIALMLNLAPGQLCCGGCVVVLP